MSAENEWNRLGIRGTIRLQIEVVKSLTHGEGNHGNTQVFRRERVLLSDGTEAYVPKISGGSLRNRLRGWAAMYALEQMKIPETTPLSKAFWNMALSGGTLTSGGGMMKLDKYRELNELFPVLGLFGYGAGNHINEGSVAVDDIDFECQENRQRMPDFMKDSGRFLLPAGSLIEEEMRTRKDPGHNPIVRRFLPSSEVAAENARLDSKKDAKSAEQAKGDSLQMIHNYETVVCGARAWSRIHLKGCTEKELVALICGLGWGALYKLEDGRKVYGIGGRNNQGHGQIAITFTSTVRDGFQVPNVKEGLMDTDANWLDARRKAYDEELIAKRDEIVSRLNEVM